MTTHEPGGAAGLAKHLVLMRGGQVLKTGPLADTFTAECLCATYGVPVDVAQINSRQIA